jgi:hypothetical protein
MKHVIACLKMLIMACALPAMSSVDCLYAAAVESPERLFAELAKLKPDQRLKRLEEGSRKEGKINFIHTFRGKLARDHVRLFEKRYPFVKVEMADMGSQDAAERFIAEETAGRHLTDSISLAVPDLPVILKQNLVAKYPTRQRVGSPNSSRGFSISKTNGSPITGASTASRIIRICSRPRRRRRAGRISVTRRTKARSPLIRRRRVLWSGFIP